MTGTLHRLPDVDPSVARFLHDGAEVHLGGRTPPGSSLVARLAMAAGIGAALTFVSPASAGGPRAQGLEFQSDAPAGTPPEPGTDATEQDGRRRGADERYPFLSPEAVAGDLEAGFARVLDAPPARPAETARTMAALPRMAEPRGDAALSVGARTSGSDFDSWPLRPAIVDAIDFRGQKVPRHVATTIFDAAQATGADPVLMMAMADKESGFVVDAKPRTSSALGLYQFLEATWLEVVKLYGPRHGLATEASAIRRTADGYEGDNPATRLRILNLRGDPGISALMACETHLAARAELRRRIGEEPSHAEAYLAHFMGTSGAGKLLHAVRTNPSANAVHLFPKAAEANPAIFVEGPRRRPRSVRQVNDVMLHAVQVRVDKYLDIEQKMAPAHAPGPR